VFILVSFVIFSTIALLGGSISERIQQNKQIEVWLKWMQIIVFIGIALFILI
jgi:threonine/homoserine/homoserine lactone efflux protein